MEIIAIIISVLSLVLFALLFFKKKENDVSLIVDAVQQLMQRELKENRIELSASLKDNREELSNGLDKLTLKLEEKLRLISDGLNKSGQQNREELSQSLKNFSDVFTQNVREFNDLQKQKFDAMGLKQDELVKSTELKLEKMRETVDEKLHKTLEERLGQSFKIVSERLEAVQKGLGEMQNLANGVGDLKKVLSNVKTRGVLGEIQLGNILEQIMAPEQYMANVKTKQGSNDHVEFAIKLPGKDDVGKEVYLPIDAKFPQEDYVRLQTAYDRGDLEGIEKANKALVMAIKKFAKDIRDKYIDPPHTTDFGIMFLPIEGLYAEVVRQPEVVALLQRDFKIIVTGPTTLAAMLNSLQMGFKTLAIQKRSSEVWQILGAVKSEFGKFGGVLEKAQKKINEANKELDSLVGTRTRMMLSKLKKVQELPATESVKLLEEAVDMEEENRG
ncbi:DNA recombination protein RmuC [Saccharicrinis carchari]|uniref:DNA recombination protein RmuC n=1 Tax=Saccharicrinis carchari TaxID=1168039 RepID=A0A521F8M0_SACCC|nr:DNA recombination protein RmuC [Saccharicrinis carchari]SMO92565.1 DNA recombination protein RmuC [Saccharicrinis carchari]